MDNISFINKDEVNEKINMIMRQTDYDYDTSYSKLTDAHYDHIKVIKAYLGITEKKAPPQKTTSVNQEIYKQIRLKLDNSMREYREKNPINIEQVVTNFKESEERVKLKIKTES